MTQVASARYTNVCYYRSPVLPVLPKSSISGITIHIPPNEAFGAKLRTCSSPCGMSFLRSC